MPKWGKTCNFPCISSQSRRSPGSPDRAVFARLGWAYARCRRSCPTSQIGVGFARFPINGSRAITRSPLRSFVSFVVKGSWFSDLARCRRFRRSRTSPPPPRSSQIGVDLRGVHPRSSQIGVAFSDEASIGAELTGLRFRAMSCDHGDPVPLPLAAN
jgi:hypothetical protein